MAMRVDSVRREIVGDFHEVSRCRGMLARSRDAGLRVTNNASLAVDNLRCNQRRESHDDRSRIAAWIGYELRTRDLLGPKLRQSINGGIADLVCNCRIRIVKAVDRAVLFLL